MTGLHEPFEQALADRFRIERELGGGACGIVYLARDLRLGRPVAIKMLRPELTTSFGVRRFEREMNIAARLRHPNIVGVHERGESDGRLFYVMDYLGGEGLRDCLRREKQLSVERALNIARDVAAALQYAHEQGVVHRDVKPENILLADGRAVVVDFGLALTVEASAERLTASGLAVGTPQYLSPEQAGGERDVGPAADQYALACVLFEMLAGLPPFTGPTASAVAMMHMTAPAPSLGHRRASTPPVVSAAVSRALAKVPADRFPSVSAFIRALDASVPVPAPSPAPSPPKPAPARRRAAAWLAGAFALAAAALLAVASRSGDAVTDILRSVGQPELDSTRYVVLPFSRRGPAREDLHVVESIHDALGRWDGISAVELYQVRDALIRRDTSVGLSGRVARSVARSLGAGRFITGEISTRDGATRVAVALHNAGRDGRALADTVVHLNAAANDADSLLSLAVESLLFGRSRARSAEDGIVGTTSRPARQAFLAGLNATRTWDLAAADSLFEEATRHDPQYARASLWLAQVRNWARGNPPDLAPLAKRAAGQSGALTARERELARALVWFSTGAYDRACDVYERLARTDSSYFPAWYGIGECNARDEVVLPQGPGSWRFRGSYQRAVIAYERAFALLPTLNRSFSARAYSRLRSLMKTSANDLRPGRAAPPDTQQFLAYPSWSADTLAFVPYPREGFSKRSAQAHATLYEAIDQQRRRFHRLAHAWAVLLPGDALAMEALGVSLELLGDRAAIDTIIAARRLALLPGDQLRMAAREAWLRVKFSLPDDPAGLRRARAMVDSLLTAAARSPEIEATALLGLAAITGNVDRAVAMSVRSSGVKAARLGVPADVARDVEALTTYAAFGGPVDSIARLLERIDVGLLNGVSPGIRARRRSELISRAATLAFPVYRLPDLPTLAEPDDYLLRAQVAFVAGNRRYARGLLDSVATQQSRLRPADRTLDVLLPEAWLLAEMGDVGTASARLDSTLAAVRAFSPNNLDDMPRAAALLRAIDLRAMLAKCLSDQDQWRRWSEASRALSSASRPASVRPPTSAASRRHDRAVSPCATVGT